MRIASKLVLLSVMRLQALARRARPPRSTRTGQNLLEEQYV
jgi:hypothetical protein